MPDPVVVSIVVYESHKVKKFEKRRVVLLTVPTIVRHAEVSMGRV